ncbi:MAG TPA: protein kinase [Vicinamibacteria bacterium]|nr:protein kinase [Vicinamibacteria bacterium]
MSETSDDKPDSPPKTPALKELSGRVGKFEIQKLLGKGAMGQVYLAHDTRLDRLVALKVMMAGIADDPELKQRFEREAKAVAKMTHPNVVMVFDFDYHTDGSPYIAMEYLKGKDLQQAMRGQPPLTVERKVSVITSVLLGLAHAHQQGIVHRDIKPANIFINLDDTVKIMDFGVARLTTASMTGTGNIVGTADYMSPEQVKGLKVDGRSDLFSVGCMLFELLAGKRPFHSDNLMAIFYKITHEEPNFDLIPAGEQYDALLPILKKALAKDLADRYQTAIEFAMALREFLKTHATTATAQHALEALVDLEAPTSPPMPMTDAPGATLIPGEDGGTIDLGTGRGGRGRPGTAATPTGRTTGKGATVTTVLGTGVGPKGQTLAPTKVGGGLAPTVVRPSRPEPRPMPARPAPQPSGGNPMLYVVLGGMAVALAGAGGYIYWKQQQDAATPSTTMAVAPTPTTTVPPEPPSTTLAVPPTAAPIPTFDEAKGKAAASLRAAQSAFKEGNYDRAITAAQKALTEDPGNKDATRMVENALQGQKAETHIRAAEAALSKSDYAAASAEADQARSLAPWDTRATSLVGRIQSAQQQAQNEVQRKADDAARTKAQQAQATVTTYISKATDQLAAKNYDAAISLYDEALKLDPGNQTATQGRIGAITAKSVAEAGSRGPAGGSGKTFVAGKTVVTSPELRAGAGADGFDDSAGVVVKKGTQAAELPGILAFEVKPESPKGADRYTVSCYLVNQGTQPIAVKEMIVTPRINGRGGAAPVQPLAASVAPHDRAKLLESSDIWKEETTSWSFEVVVRTPRGETYKNSVVWK